MVDFAENPGARGGDVLKGKEELILAGLKNLEFPDPDDY